ncbi:hypothetical protein [Haloarchaeobius sp. HRN-SO-5]|uniref:hypothetical protein n=1 Tax=Haloarchaeobius sp. HRN-SO-5 TaxID=3446118 RepID=UPI003EC0F666
MDSFETAYRALLVLFFVSLVAVLVYSITYSNVVATVLTVALLFVLVDHHRLRRELGDRQAEARGEPTEET